MSRSREETSALPIARASDPSSSPARTLQQKRVRFYLVMCWVSASGRRSWGQIQPERHMELRPLDDRHHRPLGTDQVDDAIALQCLQRSRQGPAPPAGRRLQLLQRLRLLLGDDPELLLVLGAQHRATDRSDSNQTCQCCPGCPSHICQ